MYLLYVFLFYALYFPLWIFTVRVFGKRIITLSRTACLLTYSLPKLFMFTLNVIGFIIKYHIKSEIEMEIITRKAARELGRSTYYTGKICLNGHQSYRYVQSGSCSECVNGAKPGASSITKLEKIAKLRADAEVFSTKALMFRRMADSLENAINEEKLIDHDAQKFKRKLIEERRNRVIAAELARQERIARRLAEREIKANKMLQAERRKAALIDFINFKEPVRPAYVDRAKALLMSYTIMRSDQLTIEDLWINTTPVHGVLFTMKAHRDDIPAIRAQLKQWYSADSNINEIRDNIIKTKILNLT